MQWSWQWSWLSHLCSRLGRVADGSSVMLTLVEWWLGTCDSEASITVFKTLR
jgi:hypothetical protein